MQYYIGVDGGATKTKTWIVDETGRRVGEGIAGGSNYQVSEKAIDEIQSSLESALKSASLSWEDIEHVCFGLAGADCQDDIDHLKKLFQSLPLPDYTIVCDTHIALQAGSASGRGVVLICGTAVNAIAIDSNGTELKVGGHGYPFGDRGGGGELSIEVFRAVIREWDGRGEKTALTDEVLRKLGFETVEAMYEASIRYPKTIPKHLAPLLFRAADQGDAVALDIIDEQANELARSVSVLESRGTFNERDRQVVLAGSVITANETKRLRDNLRDYLAEWKIDFTLVPLMDEPVSGAVQMAMNTTKS